MKNIICFVADVCFLFAFAVYAVFSPAVPAMIARTNPAELPAMQMRTCQRITQCRLMRVRGRMNIRTAIASRPCNQVPICVRGRVAVRTAISITAAVTMQAV